MITDETLNVVKELRQILGSITGVKKLEERLTLSYFAIIEDDEHRENIQKVASVLQEQAGNYGFDLEITPITKDELEQLTDEFALQQEKEKIVFKTKE